MRATYDLYAETNPAFISFLLYRFIENYQYDNGPPPHVSLAYLVVPLALSQRLELSFSSTNATTGFLSWLNRFPDIRVGLQRDIDVSREITSQGLRVALYCRVLKLAESGTVHFGDAKRPPKNTKSKMPILPRQAISRAERLGLWMSNTGGPAAILSALEVQL